MTNRLDGVREGRQGRKCGRQNASRACTHVGAQGCREPCFLTPGLSSCPDITLALSSTLVLGLTGDSEVSREGSEN